MCMMILMFVCYHFNLNHYDTNDLISTIIILRLLVPDHFDYSPIWQGSILQTPVPLPQKNNIGETLHRTSIGMDSISIRRLCGRTWGGYDAMRNVRSVEVWSMGGVLEILHGEKIFQFDFEMRVWMWFCVSFIFWDWGDRGLGEGYTWNMDHPIMQSHPNIGNMWVVK